MNTIYEPGGRAAEYSPLALNIYNGCTHNCAYCFNKFTPWYCEEEFRKAEFREGLLDDLVVAAAKARYNDETREINLCFTCDPYPRGVDNSKTAAVLALLRSLNVSILTKGGKEAMRDFGLMSAEKWSFGQTVGISREKTAEMWEPDAAPFAERLECFVEAKKQGIFTWASVEPVVDAEEALECIYACMPYVDYFKVGKLNHIADIGRVMDLSKWDEPDWGEFLKDVESALAGREYLVKKDLLAAAGRG